MLPTSRHALAAATFAALCVAGPVATSAVAQGGPGGGGGTPPPSTSPCVKLTPTNAGSTFKRSDGVRARFNVSNCSSSPVTVSPAYTSIVTPWSAGPITATPVPCTGPSGSGGAVTLAAGAQTGIELVVPATTCPMGPNGAILEVDAFARSAAGAKLATATAFYQLTLKP